MIYRVIRSKRKSLSLQILPEGLVVRAPYFVKDKEIDAFVTQHRRWIEKHLIKMQEQTRRAEAVVPFSEKELRELAALAKKVIPERVKYYAPLVGVTYGRITIRRQKTRWGSCSAKGDLNFNCLLMLAPPEVLDSVVVHELCHRKEMNHSKRFYDEVLRVCPDYWSCRRWLKEHGELLLGVPSSKP